MNLIIRMIFFSLIKGSEKFSRSLKDPLGCAELVEIFFDTYIIINEWDKCVAEKF